MTPDEHAHAIRRTLRKVEKAMAEHHEALACAARECGADAGLSPEVVASALPKTEPGGN